jgi:glycosyltransferase involved in cell wall biosynthesis
VKVGFLTRGSKYKGSTRVRVLQFLKYLNQAGIETRVLPRPSRKGFLRHSRYIARALDLAAWGDILFFQKPNQSKLLINSLCRLAKNLIIDIDDAVWSSHFLKTGPDSARTVQKFQQRLEHVLQHSKVAIAGSSYLERALKKSRPDAKVEIIPPCVDLEIYKNVKNSATNGKVRIGWIGSEGNLPDLLQIKEALNEVCKGRKTQLSIISSQPPDLKGIAVEFQRWSIESEVTALSKFDIGIMPLRDDERSKGRCGYKAIQYMAVGIPVVCSPVGSGLEVVEDGVTGFHASTGEEWMHRLKQLAEDADLRHRIGMQGRSRVEKLYSVQSNLPRLIDIFSQCVQQT